MGIRILAVATTPADLLLADGHPLSAVRLHDRGRPSESVDAAITQTSAAWTGRPMPPAALLPDGRLVRWEPGLLHITDADVDQLPVLGRVPADGPPVLQRPDGRPWTRADAVAEGLLDGDGRLKPWRRPRIVEVVSRTVTSMTSPNASSAGPVVRQFAALQVQLDDGAVEELQAFWHVPPEHLAAADAALPGMPLADAHEWLSEPLRRRVAADARVLCSGGAGLDFALGDVRLRLELAPDGEVLMLEGIAGHVAAAGPALAAVGDRAATLGGELTTVGGDLQFRVLGLEVGIELAAADSGGLRVRCAVPADGGDDVTEVPADGVRTAMADVAGYLEVLGDLSVAADERGEVRVPGFGEWVARQADGLPAFWNTT